MRCLGCQRCKQHETTGEPQRTETYGRAADNRGLQPRVMTDDLNEQMDVAVVPRTASSIRSECRNPTPFFSGCVQHWELLRHIDLEAH